MTNLAIAKDLQEFLSAQAVEVVNPREQMLELKSVPVGAGFSKACTNLLLWNQDGWRMFVDDNLEYSGDDPRCVQLLRGPRHKRWQRLETGDDIAGDVNDVLLTALGLLRSPLREMLDTLSGTSAGQAVDETDFDLQPEWYGELFDVRQFHGDSLELTRSQRRAVKRATMTVMRQDVPSCPVLFGASGCGKSMAARFAARNLVQRKIVRDVFVISGVSLHAGIAHAMERDERLAEAFAVAGAGVQPLIIFEQIDLLLVSTKLVRGLMSEVIDRGIRLIGVTQPEFDPRRLRQNGSLPRRLEMIGVEGAYPAEMFGVLAKRLENWSLSNDMEVLPETVATVIGLSMRSGAIEPASSMRLLESVLIDASERGLEIVSPDDLFHVCEGANA